MRMTWWMVAVVASGCTSGANVKLSLSNQTSTAARTIDIAADGTELQLKLLTVSLAPDVDPVTMDNIGVSANIWIAPECAADPSNCNVDGFTLPAGGPRVTQYFDLARPSEAVNADLEAEMTQVDVGSYRYVRLEMCKALGGQTEATVPTLLWAGPGIAEQSFTSGDCGRTSLPFDPPLTVAAGDTLAVTLGYDLSHAIVAGAPGPGSFSLDGHDDADGTPHAFRACADADSTHRVCMDFPDFAPSASVL
jgi:hypothetical protein